MQLSRRGSVARAAGADRAASAEDPGKDSQSKRKRDRENDLDEHSREAILAWIDEHLQTLEGAELGRRLFMTQPDQQTRAAEAGLEAIQKLLEKSAKKSPKSAEKLGADAVFLTMHYYAVLSGTSLGADAWPNAVMMHASVPGASQDQVDQVLLRDLSPAMVSPSEVRAVVDAFVAANWGEQGRVASEHGFDGVVISVLPEFAALQYSIGVLWGYALRGLVLRLALDRSLNTIPETITSARKRLERQLDLEIDIEAEQQQVEGMSADDSDELRRLLLSDAEAKHSGPTLLSYASEFFGHKEWIELCKPTDATAKILEAELEESTSVLSMLVGVNTFEDDELGLVEVQDEEDDEDEAGAFMAMLPEPEWEAYQRRSIMIGALLADAEARVEALLGPMQRGKAPAARFVNRLTKSGALTSVRFEQGSMMASRIQAPFHRLAEALRKNLISSKLRQARQGLDALFGPDE